MKALIKKIYDAVLRIFESVCRCLPLKASVLVCSIRAEGRLLENAKCVYDALDTDKDIFAHCMPLSKKLRFVAAYKMLTSKVIVTDDFLPLLREIELRPEQRVFQIWHAGGAFKKMGFDAPSTLNPKYGFDDTIHSQYDAVTVTGEYCRKAFSGAFRVPVEIVGAYGLPRTDKLFDKNVLSAMRNGVLERNPILRDKTVYFYCPTFREDGTKRIPFDPNIDFDKLDSELSDNEIFLIHRHPTVKYKFFEKAYSHIIDLTDSEDTLELLTVSELLITDYSSVAVEASILGLPMLFYCPDIDSYQRDFYLSFPDDLPGNMIRDARNFADSLRDAVNNRRYDKENEFRRKQTSACDGKSTERIINVIKSWLSQ